MPDLRDMPARLRALAATHLHASREKRPGSDAAALLGRHAGDLDRLAADLEAALAGARVETRYARCKLHHFLVIPLEPDHD